MEQRQKMVLVRCTSLAWNDLHQPLETGKGRHEPYSAGIVASRSCRGWHWPFPDFATHTLGISPLLLRVETYWGKVLTQLR